MRRVFVFALVLAATLGVSILLPLADASTRFAYTEEIVGPANNSDYGSLAVVFEEGSQKRFASVEYRLDAQASALFELDSSIRVARLYDPSAGVTLEPDGKGRVSGSLTLDIDDSGRCLEFPCGTLISVEYVDVTLTNLATGKVFRLDNMGLSSPT